MTNFEYETEERGFFQRFGVVIGIVVVVLVVGVVLFGKQMFSDKKAAVRHEQPPEVVMVRPLPPPPPPQPTPVEQRKEEMEKVDSVDMDEQKPDDSAPADAGITTAIDGNGPDSFGLTKGKGGTGDGSGAVKKRGGSRFGWYFAQVIRTLRTELSKHRKTRTSDFTVEVRIWPDSTGRIERAKIHTTTGNPELDRALTDDVLPGLQLDEPMPPGLRAPILVRVSARRPG